MWKIWHSLSGVKITTKIIFKYTVLFWFWLGSSECHNFICQYQWNFSFEGTIQKPKLKGLLTLKMTFSAKDAGLSTSVKDGGPVPMIIHLAYKRKDPPRKRRANLISKPLLTIPPIWVEKRKYKSIQRLFGSKEWHLVNKSLTSADFLLDSSWWASS